VSLLNFPWLDSYFVQGVLLCLKQNLKIFALSYYITFKSKIPEDTYNIEIRVECDIISLDFTGKLSATYESLAVTSNTPCPKAPFIPSNTDAFFCGVF